MAVNHKVLVLGISGMLGSMVYNYFKLRGYSVAGTIKSQSNSTYNEEEQIYSYNATSEITLRNIVDKVRPNYIINAIGVINKYIDDKNPSSVAKAIQVNSLFPYVLDKIAKQFNIRVISIATDCVYDGRRGNYSELDSHNPFDIYGKTKSLGEVNGSLNSLNIRSSIIGHENTHHVNLLDWFLFSREDQEIRGFEHHNWNGVTTLQFAELCERIVVENSFDTYKSIGEVVHYTPNKSVTKYDLLNIIKDVYSTNHEIIKVDNIGDPVDRTLHSGKKKWAMIEMKDAVSSYRRFCKLNQLYCFKNEQ